MIKVIIVQQINCTNFGHFHCPENVPENDRRSVFRTNSGLGQIPDLDKFRTISGQITTSGNAHFLDHFPDNGNVRNLYSQFFGQIPDKFRNWTNSGRIPDELQHLETLIFWITFRTMEMSGICTVSFVDKFRTNSGYSFFIGLVESKLNFFRSIHQS